MNKINYTVYAHINKTNGKIYVGITSKKPKIRWGKDGIGYRSCRYFYNAIKKYGWNNFDHEIIAEHLTEEEAKNFEKTLISKLELKNNQLGYNLTDGGDGTVGRVITDEIRKNLSMAQQGKHIGSDNQFYGKHHSEETKKHLSKMKKGKYKGKDSWRSKKVICINTGVIFDTIIEAAKYYDIQIASIVLNCQGKMHCGGEFNGEKLIWSYYDDNYNKEDYANFTYKRPGTISVICLTNGKTFQSSAEAERYYGISRSQILNCCKGRCKTTKGMKDGERYTWAFA